MKEEEYGQNTSKTWRAEEKSTEMEFRMFRKQFSKYQKVYDSDIITQSNLLLNTFFQILLTPLLLNRSMSEDILIAQDGEEA